VIAQRDLTEFSDVIQSDTKAYIATVLEVDEPKSPALALERRGTPNNQLRTLRSSKATYRDPIEDPDYTHWSASFKLEGNYLREAEEMLRESDILEIYHMYVPKKMASDIFWQRYFFHARNLQTEQNMRYVSLFPLFFFRI
jgi:hypothetical protein